MTIKQDLIDIAENVSKVHEAGKKIEYDKMWDRIQDFGNKTKYHSPNGFLGGLWGFSNFYPKYDIKPEGSAVQMFYAWEYSDSKESLIKRLAECNVILDTSKATNL